MEVWYINDNGERQFFATQAEAETSYAAGRAEQEAGGHGWTADAVLDSMTLADFREAFPQEPLPTHPRA